MVVGAGHHVKGDRPAEPSAPAQDLLGVDLEEAASRDGADRVRAFRAVESEPGAESARDDHHGDLTGRQRRRAFLGHQSLRGAFGVGAWEADHVDRSHQFRRRALGSSPWTSRASRTSRRSKSIAASSRSSVCALGIDKFAATTARDVLVRGGPDAPRAPDQGSWATAPVPDTGAPAGAPPACDQGRLKTPRRAHRRPNPRGAARSTRSPHAPGRATDA